MKNIYKQWNKFKYKKKKSNKRKKYKIKIGDKKNIN